MSTPVVEHIAQDIKAAINEIDTTDGYSMNFECVRPTRAGFEDEAAPRDGICVLIQGDPTEDEANSAHGNSPMKAWRQPWSCVAFVINDDDSTTPIDTRLNAAAADIQSKLMEDRARGGYALDTEIMPTVRFNEGSGATGIVVAVEVLYRTREDDPYTVA